MEINGMDLDARLGLKLWFLQNLQPTWENDRWDGGKVPGKMPYISEIKEMIRTITPS